MAFAEVLLIGFVIPLAGCGVLVPGALREDAPKTGTVVANPSCLAMCGSWIRQEVRDTDVSPTSRDKKESADGVAHKLDVLPVFP